MPSACHACTAMQHLIVITNNNALRFSLTGDLGDSYAHTTVHDAIERYNNAGPHTCSHLAPLNEITGDQPVKARRVDNMRWADDTDKKNA